MDAQRFLDILAEKFPYTREQSQTAQEGKQTNDVKQSLLSVSNQRQLERDWKNSQRKQQKSIFLNKEKHIAQTGRQNADKAKAQSLLSNTLAGNTFGAVNE